MDRLHPVERQPELVSFLMDFYMDKMFSLHLHQHLMCVRWTKFRNADDIQMLIPYFKGYQAWLNIEFSDAFDRMERLIQHDRTNELAQLDQMDPKPAAKERSTTAKKAKVKGGKDSQDDEPKKTDSNVPPSYNPSAVLASDLIVYARDWINRHSHTSKRRNMALSLFKSKLSQQKPTIFDQLRDEYLRKRQRQQLGSKTSIMTAQRSDAIYSVQGIGQHKTHVLSL